MDPKKKLAEIREQAKAIVDAAEKENRPISDEEHKTLDGLFAEGEKQHELIARADKDAETAAKLKDLGEYLGFTDASEPHLPGKEAKPSGKPKSVGASIAESKQFAGWLDSIKTAGQIPKGARVHSPAFHVGGMKDIVTGGDSSSAGAFVPVDHQADLYQPLDRRELTIRDLISARTTGSDTVEFVRQISRDNTAAMVAETSGDPAAPSGGLKPWGAWEWDAETHSVSTLAQLAAITKRALADAGQLSGLINQELAGNLEEALEDQIIAGNGTGENFTGILNTSGVQEQPFDTDPFVTVRRAKTLVRLVGRTAPTALVVNPEDLEDIELQRDDNGQFYGNGPFATGPNTLWGVPMVASEAIDAGSALLGDFSRAVLWDREQMSISMTDSHADFFARNLVAVLAELRAAFGVIRPQAFVVVQLDGS